jgi:hypothetical protein
VIFEFISLGPRRNLGCQVLGGFLVCLFELVLVVLEFELRASHLQQVLYHLSHTISLFALVILEMESCELFSQAGHKPQSS